MSTPIINTDEQHYTFIDTDEEDNTLVTCPVGYKIRVINYTIIANNAVIFQFFSGSNKMSGPMDALLASGNSPNSMKGLMQTKSGQDLKLILSDTVQVSGHLCYELIKG